MSVRHKMLATVHIARKEMAWDDETYRAIIQRITGRHSSGDCTDGQLGKLLDEFRRLGWQRGAMKRLSERGEIRLIYALWGEIRPLLDGRAGEGELRSFVQRQTKDRQHPEGVAAPEFLDAAGATRVIEGMKGWLGRLQQAAELGAVS